MLPLSRTGIAQSGAAAGVIASMCAEQGLVVDRRIEASQLLRAWQTANVLAETNGVYGQPLDVRDEQDCEVAERFFRLEDGRLITRIPVMPSMLTCDPMVIRQDCLCYLMERYDDHLDEAG